LIQIRRRSTLFDVHFLIRWVSMAGKAADKSMVDTMIAIDRLQRIYQDFVKPVLSRHGSDLSLTNLIFLLSIGPGDAAVNDIVHEGRYVGSNASYALNILQKQGYIERRKDANDRRNAIVSYTKKGSDLVRDLRHVSKSPAKANRDVCDLLVILENHCARMPSGF
jgi:DNA-binding MarR family transcriptional regulator